MPYFLQLLYLFLAFQHCLSYILLCVIGVELYGKMSNKWEWLRNYMKQNNISQSDAAEALQWQKPRISELLCGKRNLPVDKVFLAATFFDLNLEELTKYNSGFSNKIPCKANKLPAIVENSKITFVDVLDSSSANGRGLKASPVAKQPFTDDIIKLIPVLKGKKLKLVIASGDAMSPTINDRDIVLVDTSITKPHNDGLFLFDLHGELFIKRLVLNEFENTARIVSDNSLYPPIDIRDFSKLVCLGKISAICKMCY